VVLGGDFNAELGTPEMQPLTARYVDAFRAVHPKATREESVTFNRRFGPDPGAIDHIFVEKQSKNRLQAAACDVMFKSVGPDSVWATDHFGVIARVRTTK